MGQSPAPGIRIRTSIGSDFVAAWEVLRSIIPVATPEGAFEGGRIGVGLVRATTAPFGESVFKSQFRDYADFCCVGERGTLVKDHLADDVGSVRGQNECGTDGSGKLGGRCFGAG